MRRKQLVFKRLYTFIMLLKISDGCYVILVSSRHEMRYCSVWENATFELFLFSACYFSEIHILDIRYFLYIYLKSISYSIHVNIYLIKCSFLDMLWVSTSRQWILCTTMTVVRPVFYYLRQRFNAQDFLTYHQRSEQIPLQQHCRSNKWFVHYTI